MCLTSLRARSDVEFIIHCAATIRFDLPVKAVLRANFLPTRALLDFAASLPRLRAFTFMSTAYVNAYLPHGSRIEEKIYPLVLPAPAPRRALAGGCLGGSRVAEGRSSVDSDAEARPAPCARTCAKLHWWNVGPGTQHAHRRVVAPLCAEALVAAQSEAGAAAEEAAARRGSAAGAGAAAPGVGGGRGGGAARPGVEIDGLALVEALLAMGPEESELEARALPAPGILWC